MSRKQLTTGGDSDPRIMLPFNNSEREHLHKLCDYLEMREEEAWHYTGDERLHFLLQSWRKLLMRKLQLRTKK